MKTRKPISEELRKRVEARMEKQKADAQEKDLPFYEKPKFTNGQFVKIRGDEAIYRVHDVYFLASYPVWHYHLAEPSGRLRDESVFEERLEAV